MKKWKRAFFFLIQLYFFGSSLALAGPNLQFPELEGETLNGRPFKLPQDFEGKPIYLIIGFTKQSKKATSDCSALLDKKLSLTGYSIAILEGAPFFIKGVIKNSIRSSIPENKRSFYLVLNEGKSELSQLTLFEKKFENEAYILGLKPKALEGSTRPEHYKYEIAFRSHGVCDDTYVQLVTKELSAFGN